MGRLTDCFVGAYEDGCCVALNSTNDILLGNNVAGGESNVRLNSSRFHVFFLEIILEKLYFGAPWRCDFNLRTVLISQSRSFFRSDSWRFTEIFKLAGELNEKL